MNTMFLQTRALEDSYDQIDYELAEQMKTISAKRYEDLVYDRFLNLCEERMENIGVSLEGAGQ